MKIPTIIELIDQDGEHVRFYAIDKNDKQAISIMNGILSMAKLINDDDPQASADELLEKAGFVRVTIKKVISQVH